MYSQNETILISRKEVAWTVENISLVASLSSPALAYVNKAKWMLSILTSVWLQRLKDWWRKCINLREMWWGSTDGTFICDFRCVKSMVILAVTIVSVTASHDTYSVYRAIHFRFVWQLEPCCLDDRQWGDRCALCSTALTLQHSLQLNKNSTMNSQYSKHFIPKKSLYRIQPLTLQSVYLHQMGLNSW